ncbi:MoaD/ThiS family protein [Microbacterium sp. A196]|uniref:MoaD/ThiS family protein n=1 Tax=unclassified Microbacterium TaxID=2609290 RepID=UPI003FD364DA
MSDVSVRYFAAAAEAAGREQELLAFESAPTVGDVHDRLLESYGQPMARVLRSGSFLVDGLVTRDHAQPAGLAIDVLPQFAGG